MDKSWVDLKKQIFAAMREEGVNKAELARRLGWQAPHVNRMLGSEEKPDEETPEPGLDKLHEVAGALNTTLAELVQKAEGGKGPKVVTGAQGRDALVGKIVGQLCDLNNEELMTVSNTVRLLKEKQAAKKAAGKKSQAG